MLRHAAVLAEFFGKTAFYLDEKEPRAVRFDPVLVRDIGLPPKHRLRRVNDVLPLHDLGIMAVDDEVKKTELVRVLGQTNTPAIHRSLTIAVGIRHL